MKLVSAKVRTFAFLSLSSPEPAADSKPSPFSALYRTLGRPPKLESVEDPRSFCSTQYRQLHRALEMHSELFRPSGH